MKIYPYLHPVSIVLVRKKNNNGKANFSAIGNIVHWKQIQKRVIYIGGIFNQKVRSDIDAGNLENLETILYGLDNRYYSPGEQIGKGYSEGLVFRK